MRPRHLNIWRRAALSMSVVLAACIGHSALAKPLDPEACALLKSQRDALAALGVGDVVRQRPPERRADITPERAKQVRTLISLDGQLRFRCGVDLLLPTLKPDPVEEFVDTGDTAGSGRPSPRPPVAKKPKVAKAPAPATPDPKAQPAAAPAAVGLPVPQAPRTANIKTGASGEPGDQAPKVVTKPKAKQDNAFRAPPGGDPNATPLDKQLPKSQ
jgi:hypothetical protein